jgi:hypothetical protein
LKECDLDDEIIDEKKRKQPEDAISDLPENQKAREFLKNTPTKGLWLPMGSEVKTMNVFRCKAMAIARARKCVAGLREKGSRGRG